MTKDKEIFHEKNISAKQKKTPKDSWISNKNEICQWPQGNQPKKKEGSQIIGRLDFKFPTSYRLKKTHQFARVTKEKNRIRGSFVVVDFLIQENTTLKLGIVASKKFGKSPERNRFKRIVRESFRLSKNFLHPNLWIIVRPRPKAKLVKMQEVKSELVSLLQKVKQPNART
ncbi:MAG: ribonuclease P protein component [Chlamydiae bacterium CG10_big_fil_rev_8_21_14_0_10_35_9]|nr:MAG: ribonuclease P protein component [Chlamydiae bacterium CG10_big_fil_rev_8_21_14_0_10_35_9]